MIPEIKRILYATDLSENARHALGYAASISNRYGASLVILHTMEDLPADAKSIVEQIIGEEKWEELKKTNKEKSAEAIKTRILNVCDELASEEPECPFIPEEIIVKIGHPVEEILKLAERPAIDLIVMGSHGRGIFADAVMGSTSRRVLRRCKKPVLIVRLPKA